MSVHAETPNPTPANFVASGPYASDVSDPNDPLYTLAPTPANLLNAVVNSVVNSVDGAVSSPTASPTATPEVVSTMQQIFPTWDLNEGETYTVLVVFFLVAIGVLVGMIFLILYCMNRGHQKEILAEDTPSGSPSGSQVGEERPLLQPSKTESNIPALKTLLAPPGKTCQMYPSKGPKTVKMSINGNTLVWESSSSFMAPKTYSIDLATVLFVTANKKSKNLRSKAVVPDELCFSLVTHDASLDISVDRKNERDVLVLGFGEIVSQLKSASNP